MFGKLRNWVKISVAKVPDDIAVCEFECRTNECRLLDWAHCERRLRAVELLKREQEQEKERRSHH